MGHLPPPSAEKQQQFNNTTMKDGVGGRETEEGRVEEIVYSLFIFGWVVGYCRFEYMDLVFIYENELYVSCGLRYISRIR